MVELAGKRVVVMGLGRFGGGIGVTRFLAERGASVLVTDQLDEQALAASLEPLADLDIDYRLGGHAERDFTEADLVVVNPAVDPRRNLYLDAARSAGARLTSEIGLLIDAACSGPQRRRTIGVTGTAGKTTTVAMIGHILRDNVGDRHVHVGGNIGGSLLGEIDTIGPRDWVVLELSSFMLEALADWSPHVAVVTNIAPNHLDRHPHFDAYVKAKQTILRHQTHEDRAVLGPGVEDWRWVSPAVAVTQAEPFDELRLAIPGRHNRINATLAIVAAEAAGVRRSDAIEALADFRSLPHRLQRVCERDGVGYVNDSKATTPEATVLALDSFDLGQVHLIVGGYDKKSDLSEMARRAAERCAGIYAIGQTGEAIAARAARAGRELAEGSGKARRCEVQLSRTLDAAVAAARRAAWPGQVVLLSPGCASWDQFDNYEQRGDRFAELARQGDAESA